MMVEICGQSTTTYSSRPSPVRIFKNQSGEEYGSIRYDSGVADCLPMNREKMGISQVFMIISYIRTYRKHPYPFHGDMIPVLGGRSNFWQDQGLVYYCTADFLGRAIN